ncbi:hypothetical protein [Dokdonella immobilis]|nr:hypothetical protein [Dokdonella immobilis]
MRTILLAVFLLASTCCFAATQSSCKDGNPSPDQSWNPPAATVTPKLRHFYDLGSALEAAQSANDFKKMQALAKEYLVAAEGYHCNWNYGNAVHDANSALGLSSLAKGDRAGAIMHLLEAAKSPGSPQLDSFGPNMLLANELVAAGERDAVIAYLRGVQLFWKMDDGEIEKWIEELKAGKTPDFSMQLI